MKNDANPRVEARITAARALPEAKDHQIVAGCLAKEGWPIEKISVHLRGHIAAENFIGRDDAPWRTDPRVVQQASIDHHRAEMAALGVASFPSSFMARKGPHRAPAAVSQAAANVGPQASANAWDEVIAEFNSTLGLKTGAMR